MAALTPSQAAAQDCTVKCGCISGGCGGQASGGNGSSCDASGNGCFVTECETEETEQLLVFAPDGSLLRFGTPDYTESATGTTTIVTGAGSWEALTPGRAVARDCHGLIVASYMDRRTAAKLRSRSAVITSD